MSQIGRELQLTLQAAVREAQVRRHAYLTVEHLLYALVHDDRGVEIFRNCGARVRKLRVELHDFLDTAIEAEPGDQPIETAQTLALHRVIQAAMSHADNAEKEEVEAGDLIASIFQEPDCHAVQLLREQGVSRLDVLRYISHGISRYAEGTDEEESAGDASEQELLRPDDDGDEIADPLEAFATNLSELASQGKLDPLVGRETEIARTTHILARRRKNNPIFVGESGVGKTAMAEGLALRIYQGSVQEELQTAEIYSLDLGSMLAGTKYRGDFEARFKALVAAVQKRENPILFIDEIHTILGAGAAQGATVDASSMLKPLLQSGELRCMGSTTHADYRHFERDRALARRFQKVEINEPSVDETVQILRGLAPQYEAHHGVRFTPSALKAAAELSARYIQDRHLPDKAIDVIDEVGAAVRLGGGKDRKQVGVRDVEQLVSRMARIPITKTSVPERERLGNLKRDLEAVVYGQNDAISTLVQAVKRTRAGLGGTQKPIGSFLFVGPTGVGKTELAKQLANCLAVPFLRFDMSEYAEKHAVARLIGAPPGYVGYDQGGMLVDRVRKNPYTVLLLDEIEKAHSDLFDILLQVMDHATLTDNHGSEADFRHVTLIMTSNAGARDVSARSIGFGDTPAGSALVEIERLFAPEFRNRLDEIVRFVQLSPEVMEQVVEKFMRELEEQLQERKVKISLREGARTWLAEKGFDPLFGARPLSRVIQVEVKDKIADEILFGRLEKGGKVVIDAADGELSFSYTS
ncbi:MAG: ATP-dependent Clp protease ATP-binding subunit ClpA [Myxococcota bacterium]|nr:ATP-dependent Clp protease ATP-binding subunit ClpA [Myxococcota bacterium]